MAEANLRPGARGADATLAARLADIHVRHPAADPDMVAEVVRSVLATMNGDLSAKETSLLAEVEELGRTIATAKAEIAALEVDVINASHIPFATDELDAIIAHTAAATDAILENCEILDQVAAGLTGPDAARLQEVTTRIYEACGFQDITGQRITKVVGALKAIEAKVEHIVATFGPGGGTDGGDTRPSLPRAVDTASLLNGPQLPAAAMDQSDIDKLLASFD